MTIKIKPTDLHVGTTDLKLQGNPPYQITKIKIHQTDKPIVLPSY